MRLPAEDGRPSRGNCPVLLPLAVLATAVAMLRHVGELPALWRELRDGASR